GVPPGSSASPCGALPVLPPLAVPSVPDGADEPPQAPSSTAPETRAPALAAPASSSRLVGLTRPPPAPGSADRSIPAPSPRVPCSAAQARLSGENNSALDTVSSAATHYQIRPRLAAGGPSLTRQSAGIGDWRAASTVGGKP